MSLEACYGSCEQAAKKELFVEPHEQTPRPLHKFVASCEKWNVVPQGFFVFIPTHAPLSSRPRQTTFSAPRSPGRC
eukprot:2156611-Rhodomonas_salina.1